MAELNNIKNLLLPAIGNYKKAYNNYPKIDDIDKVTKLLYNDLVKLNNDIESEITLTPEQIETLKYFVYNPVTDKLEAAKALVTTLSSLFLGEQHAMQSGGENVFFTNQVSKTTYYPMWGGLKDMNILENRSQDGIIKPSGRNYFGYGEFELNGVLGTGVTDCSDIVTIPQNTSGIGAEIVFEERILPEETVYYEVWWGTDDAGVQAFEDKKRGLDIQPGDLVDWIYTHPLESKTGQVVLARLRVEGTDGNFRVLQCRKSDTGKPYFKLKAFGFTDDNLAFEGDTSTFIGWQDFADSNTSEASPIIQPTVNGGEVALTNNNNDTLTDGNTSVNAETSITGLNDLWNTTTNTFDFAGTGIEKNDLLSLRIHLNIAASIIAQDFSLRFDFYDSPGATGNFIFSLNQHVATEALSAGVFRERITTIDAFIGESIVNGSAKVYLVGTKSFEVEVIGFNIRIFKIAR